LRFALIVTMNPELITNLFAWGTLIADIVLVLFIIILFVRNTVFDRISGWVGRHALALSFFAALGGLVGSLVYSEVIGFEPCVLCWIQRLFMYPQVLLFGLGLWWKEKAILAYGCALSILGGLVALYHSYTQLGGHSLTPCTSDGGACSKIYVLEFGYITIPMMSLTLFLILIALYIAARRRTRTLSFN
jgi:disulfide bond formation protein DsbB